MLPPDGILRRRTVLSTMAEYRAGERYRDAVKLSSNENVLGPSPLALAALSQATSQLHFYPEGSCLSLRAALAATHSLSEAHIIIGNGSDEIMQFAAAAFLNEKEETLIASHTFSQYEFVTRLFAGIPIKIAMQNYCHDLSATLGAINLRTKIIFLCSPNNPTGTVIRGLHEFLAQVPPSVLVVVDQAYIDYADSECIEDAIPLVSTFPNLLVLRTFSKIYGLAGLRIGYGVGDPQLIASLFKVKPPFNLGTLAQIAAEAALKDSNFVTRSRTMNREGKKLLRSACKELGIPTLPSQGNFLCLQLPCRSEKFCQLIKQKGVTVRSLTSFGLPFHIRVSIGTVPQLELFLKALPQILDLQKI